MTHRGTRPHPAPCPNGLKWRITGGGTWQLAQVEPNGYKGIQRICRSELAQRIDTRGSAATDRYAALWGSPNPTIQILNADTPEPLLASGERHCSWAGVSAALRH